MADQNESGDHFPFSSFVTEPESIIIIVTTSSSGDSRGPSSVETSPAASAAVGKKRQSRSKESQQQQNNGSSPTGSSKVADQNQELPALAVSITEGYVKRPHSYNPNRPGKEKKIIRTGHWPVNSHVRPKLWTQLLQLNLSKCESSADGRIDYSDALRCAFGEKDIDSGSYRTQAVELPGFVEKDFISKRHLSPEGVLTAHRIAMLISFYQPDITYCPLLYPMMVIHLHYFTEQESFQFVKILLSVKKPLSYLTQTKHAFGVMVEVFKLLAKEYCKESFNFLKSQEGGSERVFDDWLSWIFVRLPFHHVVRVMDCYLYEGPKVLFRVGMAILNLFHENRTEKSKNQKKSNLKIEEFCSNVNFSPSVLLKTAFGFKNLSKSKIQKATEKVSEKGICPSSSIALQRSSSLRVLTAYDLQVPTDTKSSVMTTRDKLSEAQKGDGRKRFSLQGNDQSFSFVDAQSNVIVFEQWERIYHWLPVRVRVNRPRLLFSTAEDGSSLKTFYNKVEGHDPTLLVIKAKDKEIVGAYCTGDWNGRNGNSCGISSAVSSRYFGSGENFLFRLFPEPAEVFGWAGLNPTNTREERRQVGDGGDLDGAAVVPEEEDINVTELKRKEFRMNFFATGNNDSISIGGGNKGPGLFIDENFSNVASSPCDTYTNPCLFSQTSPRPIVIFEAFGFE